MAASVRRLYARKLPRVTRELPHQPSTVRLRGYHPLWPGISGMFTLGNEAVRSPHSTSPGAYRRRIRFDLFRFRSPLLAESLLFSFPPVTKMFYFTGFPFPHLKVMGISQIIELRADVLFGNLGVSVYVRLTRAYRSLSRPSSVPKPRYPPNSEGVLATTKGKVRTEPEPDSLFRHQTLALLRAAG